MTDLSALRLTPKLKSMLNAIGLRSVEGLAWCNPSDLAFIDARMAAELIEKARFFLMTPLRKMAALGPGERQYCVREIWKLYTLRLPAPIGSLSRVGVDFTEESASMWFHEVEEEIVRQGFEIDYVFTSLDADIKDVLEDTEYGDLAARIGRYWIAIGTVEKSESVHVERLYPLDKVVRNIERLVKPSIRKWRYYGKFPIF